MKIKILMNFVNYRFQQLYYLDTQRIAHDIVNDGFEELKTFINTM